MGIKLVVKLDIERKGGIVMMELILVALAVSAISITITKAGIFEKFRALFKNKWLGKLMECTYCMSHWVALALVLLVYPIGVWSIVNIFAVVAISAVISWVIIDMLFNNDSIPENVKDTLQKAKDAIEGQQERIKELEGRYKGAVQYAELLKQQNTEMAERADKLSKKLRAVKKLVKEGKQDDDRMVKAVTT